jgi:hypothetical protein
VLKFLKIKINVDGFPSQKYKIASRTCLGIPIIFGFSAAHFSFFRLSPTVCVWLLADFEALNFRFST